jgi:RNA polymerase sigma factor (TIGR02999 family)
MGTEMQRTGPLDDGRGGNREPLDDLFPLLYRELRLIAHRHLSTRRDGATLNTTALVNEAFLKLSDQSRAGWNDRVHFLALAAVAMRHILTDRAKARAALKRGGAVRHVTLEDTLIESDDQPDALLQVNDAIDRLASIDARLARVVEFRFFGGLSNDEIATALGITERTVERDWVKARMLLRELLLT